MSVFHGNLFIDKSLPTDKGWHVYKASEQMPQDFDNPLNGIDHSLAFHRFFSSEYIS